MQNLIVKDVSTTAVGPTYKDVGSATMCVGNDKKPKPVVTTKSVAVSAALTVKKSSNEPTQSTVNPCGERDSKARHSPKKLQLVPISEQSTSKSVDGPSGKASLNGKIFLRFLQHILYTYYNVYRMRYIVPCSKCTIHVLILT